MNDMHVATIYIPYIFHLSEITFLPPGSIYDATQSYDISFYSAGALLFVCAGLHCAVPLVQRLWSQDSRPVSH